jgi:hypothetical protein
MPFERPGMNRSRPSRRASAGRSALSRYTDRKLTMNYDTTKVDEVVLALLHLNAHSDHGITRAWKAFDWDAMDRLHAEGFISDPKSKAKSVVLTEEGERKAEELFRRYFAKVV